MRTSPQAYRERLGNQTQADISHLKSVNKGYGVCGDYNLANVEHGHFYHHSALL